MYTQLQLRDSARPPVTLTTLAKLRAEGVPIAALTCYDASFAVLVDEADADLVLVGDSLGMVIQGHDTTVPVTMDHMVYHTHAVARGTHRPFLVADLPFMSYSSPEQALANSVRLMQEGGARMVKLESGAEQLRIVEFLTAHDIPVCAHLGLRPRSVHKTGGFRVQGREQEAASRIVQEAKNLEGAGADIVLLECVPNELGEAVTRALQVPVIGIGAGPACQRPDPGDLRRARHHLGPQAEVRAQFPEGPGFAAGCAEGLCGGREVARVSRRRNTASPDADAGTHRRRPRGRSAIGARRADRGFRAHHGVAACRPHEPAGGGALPRRPRHRQRVRESAAVRAGRGFRALSAHARG